MSLRASLFAFLLFAPHVVAPASAQGPVEWQARLGQPTLPVHALTLAGGAADRVDVFGYASGALVLSHVDAAGIAQPATLHLVPRLVDSQNERVEVAGFADSAYAVLTPYGLARVAANGELEWSRRVHAPAHGTTSHVAVGAGGDAYVAALVDHASDRRWFVARVRGSDGTLLWTRSAFDSAPATSAAPTLVPLADGSVIACGALGAPFDEHRAVRFAAADGAVVWTHRLQGSANGGLALCADRAIDDRLYAVTARREDGATVNRAVELSTLTGAETWNTALPAADQDDPDRLEPPVVDDAGLTIAREVNGPLQVDRVARANGAPLWQAFVEQDYDSIVRGAADGTVTVAGRHSIGFFVERLRAADGSSAWRHESTPASQFTLDAFALAPDGDALLGVTALIVADANAATRLRGEVRRLRAEDGGIAWLASPAKARGRARGFVTAAGSDRVLIGGGDEAPIATTRTLDAATGAVVGELVETESTPNLSLSANATRDACGDGSVMTSFGTLQLDETTTGNRVAVVKVDVATGTERWRREWLGTPTVTQVVVDVACTPSGHVFVTRLERQTASFAKSVEKLDATTGATVWSQVPAGIGAQVVRAIGEDVVTASLGFSTVPIALRDGATGMVRWQKSFSAVSSATVVAGFGDGDVLVAQVLAPGGNRVLDVQRLAAADGVARWTTQLADPGSGPDVLDAHLVLADDRVLLGSRYAVPGGTRVSALAGATGQLLWERDIADGAREVTSPNAFAVDASGTIHVSRGAAFETTGYFGATTLARLDPVNGAVLGLHALATIDYTGIAPDGDAEYRLLRIDADRAIGAATHYRRGRAAGVGVSSLARPAAWSAGDADVALSLLALDALADGSFRATYSVRVGYAGDVLPAPLRVRVVGDVALFGNWSCAGACLTVAGRTAVDADVMPAPGESVEITGTVAITHPAALATLAAQVVAPFAVGEASTADNQAQLGIADAVFSSGFE